MYCYIIVGLLVKIILLCLFPLSLFVLTLWLTNIYSTFTTSDWRPRRRGQGQGRVCPRAVLEMEDSPRGPHPCVLCAYERTNLLETIIEMLAADAAD